MRIDLHWLNALPIQFSPYPIAKGEEEYRIKRQILQKINKHRARAAVNDKIDRGCVPNNQRNHG